MKEVLQRYHILTISTHSDLEERDLLGPRHLRRGGEKVDEPAGPMEQKEKELEPRNNRLMSDNQAVPLESCQV